MRSERRASRTSSMSDRKSTRLNSSHLGISYAVFCLKKKRSLRPALSTMPSINNGHSMRPLFRWGLAVFCLISIAVSGRQAFWYFSHGPVVTDLRIFMTGVDMVKAGQGHQLYHFDAQERA